MKMQELLPHVLSNSLIMIKILVVTWLVIFPVMGQATAVNQSREAKTAQIKAEILEEKVASGDSKVIPAPVQLITKSQVQSVDPTGEKPLDDVITCLSRTIYWEARGSETAAMEAVANVVMNRVAHKSFPNSVCEVVKQGQERGACQFSWWCDGRPDDAEEDKSYTIAKEIARKTLNRQVKDITAGALYFHHRRVTPSWSKEYIKTVEIDKFIFYKPVSNMSK